QARQYGARRAQSGDRPGGAGRTTEARVRRRRSLGHMCAEITRRLLSSDHGIQERKFVGSEEPIGADDGNDSLVNRGETAVPVAFLSTESIGEGLQASHAGHLVDAIDKKSGARPAQNEDKSARVLWKAKVSGAVDDEEGFVAALKNVTDFLQAGHGYFRGGAGK